MKLKFHLFCTVATGRWAVSLPSAIYLAILAFIFALEREASFNDVPNYLSIKIILSGLLASYLYLFVIQALLLKSRKVKLQKLNVCMFVWASTGFVNGLIADLYAKYALNSPSHLIVRVGGSTLLTTISFALTAFYFGTVAKGKVEIAALESLGKILAKESAGLSVEQKNAYEQATLRFEMALTPRVKQLQELTRTLDNYATSDERKIAIANLQAQAEQLRLKLNEELTAMEKLHGKESPKLSEYENSTFKSSYRSSLLPAELSVRTSFVVLFLGGLVGQISRNGPSGALASLLASFMLTTFLFTFRTALHKINQFSRKTIYPWAYVGVFAVEYFYTAHMTSIGIHLNSPFQPWYTGAKVVFAVYLSSVLSQLMIENNESVLKLKAERVMRKKEISELSESSDNLKLFIKATNFGNLQGKISGVIFALNMLKDELNSRGSNVDFDRYVQDTNLLLSESIWEIRNFSLQGSSD